MNLENIKSITMSLLKREGDVATDAAEYSKLLTAKFTPPGDFPRSEEMFEILTKNMYEDLKKNAPEGADSIGMWIEMDTITLDNAISLNTLESIRMYSSKSQEDEEINVAWEFFKLTFAV